MWQSAKSPQHPPDESGVPVAASRWADGALCAFSLAASIPFPKNAGQLAPRRLFDYAFPDIIRGKSATPEQK
jgi:hypothetical protein